MVIAFRSKIIPRNVPSFRICAMDIISISRTRTVNAKMASHRYALLVRLRVDNHCRQRRQRQQCRDSKVNFKSKVMFTFLSVTTLSKVH